MIKKEEELFFVGVKDPTALRREVLLSSKNAIQFLKKNEELNELRIIKINNIMQYKNDVKELNALMNRLKEKLPKAKIRIKQEPLKMKERVSRPMPRKISELEKLEMELGDIEKKIGRLR